MPRYTVSGVDQEDGGLRFTTIYADNQDDAINKVGFLVDKVELAPEPTPATAIQHPTATPPVYLSSFAILSCIDAGERLTMGWIGASCIVAGFSFALMGEVLRAFRDIARNSFRR